MMAEIAIAACDLAEVLGMAIGLQLLFGAALGMGCRYQRPRCFSVVDADEFWHS